MTHARARLWLGVSCVGTLVTLSAAMLWLGLPAFLRELVDSDTVGEAPLIAIAPASIALILAPFDWMGGYFVPNSSGRSNVAARRFLGQWLRSVVLHWMLATAGLLAVLAVGRAAGNAGAIAAVLLGQVVLLALQSRLARLIGGLRIRSRESQTTVVESEGGFSGGITGLPGLERTIQPANWNDEFDVDERAALELRRREAIASGSRRRGVILALLWNTAAFAIAVHLPMASATTGPGLVTALLYFTLLQFVGLLILPRPSREGVVEVDRRVVERGVSLPVFARALTRLEDRQDGEPERSRELESVFHPVPCVRRRIAELSLRTRPVRGFWHAARTALFLSWIVGGPLARAVHCNVGRPELWVLLPD